MINLENINVSKKLILAVVLGVFTLAFAGQFYENVDAHELMVLQDPVDGDLHIYTTPGWKPQWFGKVTKYPLRAEYVFNDEPSSKKLQFNDGGVGWLYGAVNWEMPLDTESVVRIHKKYGSAEAVEKQAVARMIDNAVYLAGPLMSSTESSGERRAELVHYINDQAENGVYVTVTEAVKSLDPITGAETVARVARIVKDDKGGSKRQQDSILNEFDIRLLPISITNLDYDDAVEKQIAERQKATTQVQIAQANARKAQQDTITVEEQGKANAATQKWEQEALKAKAVVAAQQEFEVAAIQAKQRLDVAALDARAAAETKRKEILLGEGEAERKRLAMHADGALTQKLEAYKEVSQMYATAIGAYTGSWVPAIQMGDSGGKSVNGAQDLINLLTAKTAKDLSLDMGVKGQ
jgi:hypothetical protein